MEKGKKNANCRLKKLNSTVSNVFSSNKFYIYIDILLFDKLDFTFRTESLNYSGQPDNYEYVFWLSTKSIFTRQLEVSVWVLWLRPLFCLSEKQYISRVRVF